MDDWCSNIQNYKTKWQRYRDRQSTWTHNN